MFSMKVKQEIASRIQKILQEVDDCELPEGNISFLLHVDGAESGSWANIVNKIPKLKATNIDGTVELYEDKKTVIVPRELIRNTQFVERN